MEISAFYYMLVSEVCKTCCIYFLLEYNELLSNELYD